MAVKRYLVSLGWALGMLVLILDSRTAMAGAAEGMELCIRTLIPSLFPFFVLSAMLTGSLSGGGLMVTGILSGYPVGAANAARAWRAGLLDRAEAERMAVLCSCAGPSFLFGVLGPVLGDAGTVFLVWGAYLLSVLALWLLLPKSKRIRTDAAPVGLQQGLNAAIRAMAGVCGWVILFRVVLTVLDRWVLWLLPDWGRIVLCGILELSNGCLALEGIDPGYRPVLAAGLVSFGGLCVMLQTAGVTQGLSLGLYFPGKVFQSAVSMLAVSLLRPGTLPPVVQAGFLLTAAACVIVLRKTEKRCGNRRPVIV